MRTGLLLFSLLLFSGLAMAQSGVISTGPPGPTNPVSGLGPTPAGALFLVPLVGSGIPTAAELQAMYNSPSYAPAGGSAMGSIGFGATVLGIMGLISTPTGLGDVISAEELSRQALAQALRAGRKVTWAPRPFPPTHFTQSPDKSRRDPEDVKCNIYESSLKVGRVSVLRQVIFEDIAPYAWPNASTIPQAQDPCERAQALLAKQKWDRLDRAGVYSNFDIAAPAVSEEMWGIGQHTNSTHAAIFLELKPVCTPQCTIKGKPGVCKRQKIQEIATGRSISIGPAAPVMDQSTGQPYNPNWWLGAPFAPGTIPTIDPGTGQSIVSTNQATISQYEATVQNQLQAGYPIDMIEQQVQVNNRIADYVNNLSQHFGQGGGSAGYSGVMNACIYEVDIDYTCECIVRGTTPGGAPGGGTTPGGGGGSPPSGGGGGGTTPGGGGTRAPAPVGGGGTTPGSRGGDTTPPEPGTSGGNTGSIGGTETGKAGTSGIVSSSNEPVVYTNPAGLKTVRYPKAYAQIPNYGFFENDVIGAPMLFTEYAITGVAPGQESNPGKQGK